VGAALSPSANCPDPRLGSPHAEGRPAVSARRQHGRHAEVGTIDRAPLATRTAHRARARQSAPTPHCSTFQSPADDLVKLAERHDHGTPGASAPPQASAATSRSSRRRTPSQASAWISTTPARSLESQLRPRGAQRERSCPTTRARVTGPRKSERGQRRITAMLGNSACAAPVPWICSRSTAPLPPSRVRSHGAVTPPLIDRRSASPVSGRARRPGSRPEVRESPISSRWWWGRCWGRAGGPRRGARGDVRGGLRAGGGGKSTWPDGADRDLTAGGCVCELVVPATAAAVDGLWVRLA
jgi:hypothetical protein